jgi:hypothetical protein
VDPVTAWLIALLVAFGLGAVGTVVALSRSRGAGWFVLGMTIAALGGLLILGWYWSITVGHLTG